MHRTLALVILAAAAPASAQLASSHFDTGIEGWKVVDVDFYNGVNPPMITDTYDPAWSDADGAPGGHIRQLADPNPLWQFFAAPASFLGDQSAAFGHTLTFELRDSADGQSAEILPAVMLVGAGHTLFFDASWPLAEWTPYDIPFGDSGWYHDLDTSSLADPQKLQAVLADLTGLYINADWATIPNSVGLDSVVVTPAPSSCTLALTAIAAMARRRRR